MVRRTSLVLTIGLIAGLACSAFAASGGPVKSPAWAFEFGLANATLTSFDGATISLRRQTSPGAAWRFGFSSSYSKSSNENDRNTVGSSLTAHDEDDNSTHNHTLSVTRLWFPAPDAVVRPWYGLGLEGSWGGSHREHETVFRDAGTVTGTQSYSDDSSGPGAGALALFGLEWNATERFVLHAQYGQALRWRRRNYTYDERQTYSSTPDVVYHREGPVTEWTFSGESARAGVSVFW
ncbi:MAG: hypothetical protein U0704_02560 [Candidatus Eisenbacteria bacterium]